MASLTNQDGQSRYAVAFEREKDFPHLAFIDLITGAELAKARARSYDLALLRFTGTATFVHTEGDETEIGPGGHGQRENDGKNGRVVLSIPNPKNAMFLVMNERVDGSLSKARRHRPGLAWLP
jgi:hypothetical protein